MSDAPGSSPSEDEAAKPASTLPSPPLKVASGATFTSTLNSRSTPFVPASHHNHLPLPQSPSHTPLAMPTTPLSQPMSGRHSGRPHLIPRHIRSLSQTHLVDCDIPLATVYNSVVDLYCDEASGLEHCFEFAIKHGGLPQLTVRYIRDGSSDELVKPHVDWMMEDCDRTMPCLGVDCETGIHSVRLLQISTKSRCLLVRIPLQSHTHLYSTHSHSHPHHHHHHHQHVRLASSIITLLESRHIHKSGAELWGDALDLYRDLHVSMNAGLNMSWCHRRGNYSLSLEHMTNLICGKDAFIKDKETTVSDWDRPVLTFRQLVYGALDAQSSFIVANIHDSVSVRPPPFHCSDMSSSWLTSASSWLNIVKYIQKEQEAMRAECQFESLTFTDSGAVVRLKHAQSRVRLERFVYVVYTDSSEEMFRVDAVNNRDVTLAFTSQHRYAHRVEQDVRSVTLLREREHELIMNPIRQYFTRCMHGEEPFNPFIAAMLDQTFAAKSSTVSHGHGHGHHHSNHGHSHSHSYNSASVLSSPRRSSLAVLDSPSLSPQSTRLDRDEQDTSANYDYYTNLTAAPQPFWYDEEVRDTMEIDSHQLPLYNRLCDEQRAALALSATSRIVAITGAGGSGKSLTLVAEILRSLYRRSYHPNSNNNNHSEDRVLVLCDTPIAARHLAAMVAHHLLPTDMALCLSLDFVSDWQSDNDSEYSHLLTQGYLVDSDANTDSDCRRHANRRVLVTTLSQAFSLSLTHPSLVHHRPTLVFDDANQAWMVKVLLLLRILISTERMVVGGDYYGLTPSLCKDIHHPLSLLSQLTLVAKTHSHSHLSHTYLHRPRPFNVTHCHLHCQYRMMKHLTSMISTAFYPQSHVAMVPLDDCNEDRGLHWRDVRGLTGKSDYNNKSIFNVKECEEVMRIWSQLRLEGFDRNDIVVLSFYEAQRAMLCENGGEELGMRVLMIEQFTGREVKCVVLTLASEFPTPTLTDRYRINVACSRAMLRLYIVGNRTAMTRGESLWKTISDYEQLEPARKKQQVPDLVNDFPSLGTPALSVSHSPSIRPTAQSPNIKPSASVSESVHVSIMPIGSVGASPRLLPSQSPQARASLGGWSSLLNTRPSSPQHTAENECVNDGNMDGHNEGATVSAWRKPPHSPHSLSLRNTPAFSPAFLASSPALPSSIVVDDYSKPFRWRTSVCHFYLKGHCQNGASCNFAHGEWELRSVAAATTAHAAHQQAQQAPASTSATPTQWKLSPASPKQFQLPPQPFASQSLVGGMTALALNPPVAPNSSILSHTSSIFTPQKQSAPTMTSWANTPYSSSSSSSLQATSAIFTPTSLKSGGISLLTPAVGSVSTKSERLSNGSPLSHEWSEHSVSVSGSAPMLSSASKIDTLNGHTTGSASKAAPSGKRAAGKVTRSPVAPPMSAVKDVTAMQSKPELAAAPTVSPGSASRSVTGSGNSSLSGSGAKRSFDDWQCPTCTFINTERALKCEMCDALRKDEWKPVSAGKKPIAIGAATVASAGTGVPASLPVSVVDSNPFTMVQNPSSGRKKGR